MSSPEPFEAPEANRYADEAREVLAEFGGDAEAAIAALLHDLDSLNADRDAVLQAADRAVSRGFIRGVFSAGARRERDGE